MAAPLSPTSLANTRSYDSEENKLSPPGDSTATNASPRSALQLNRHSSVRMRATGAVVSTAMTEGHASPLARAGSLVMHSTALGGGLPSGPPPLMRNSSLIFQSSTAASPQSASSVASPGGTMHQPSFSAANSGAVITGLGGGPSPASMGPAQLMRSGSFLFGGADSALESPRALSRAASLTFPKGAVCMPPAALARQDTMFTPPSDAPGDALATSVNLGESTGLVMPGTASPRALSPADPNNVPADNQTGSFRLRRRVVSFPTHQTDATATVPAPPAQYTSPTTAAPPILRPPSGQKPPLQLSPSQPTPSGKFSSQTVPRTNTDRRAPRSGSESEASVLLSDGEGLDLLTSPRMMHLYRCPPSWCRTIVRRHKGGLFDASKYYLHVDNTSRPSAALAPTMHAKSKSTSTKGLPKDAFGMFLLSARRRGNKPTTNFLVSLAEHGKLERLSDEYFGKVRATGVTGTEFIIYDDGESPDVVMETAAAKRKPPPLRRELAIVLYEAHMPGTCKGPRKITVVLPAPMQQAPLGKPPITERWAPLTPDESILAAFKAEPCSDRFVIMHAVEPSWSEHLQCHQLEFIDRADVRSSVKNFQLCFETVSGAAMAMQFGKLEDNAYFLDYRAPLNAALAFSVALTVFDNKLLCE